MIKFVHRYNKIITYVFLFMAICFMFSGVGLDILHSGQNDQLYAIKVNDRTITPLEFERTKENLTERYRRMFGSNFETFAKSLKLNLTQQAIDTWVDSTLLSQEAASWGFAADDDAVKKYLVTKVFENKEISKEAVKGLLQNLGMNYKQFSREVKQELARDAFMGVLRDAAFVGSREIEAEYIKQETMYSIVTATIAHNDFLNAVQAPSDDILKNLYNSSAANYELPARISYEYLAFHSKDFEKDVQVQPSDLEFYYSEHKAQFKTPEEVRVRSIKLLYPKDNDPAAMAAVKSKAKAAHEEAVAGKPFQDLVTTYSDDLPSKLAGGDRGWIARGKESKAFDGAAFRTPPGGVADLIEADYGFEIVKVEEKREAAEKPFEQVKSEIENILKTQEAPSFAAAKARELVDEAKRTGQSIADVAKKLGLPAPQRSILTPENQDPDPLLAGLTQQAMRVPAPDRLIATVLDIGDSSVALQIKEFKEPTTPAFEAVKDKVLAEYKQREAKKLAEARAKEIREAIQQDPSLLDKEAKAKGAAVVGPLDLSRASPSSSLFPNLPAQLTADAFSSMKTPRELGRVYPITEGFLIAAVIKVTRPDPKAAATRSNREQYEASTPDDYEKEMVGSTLSILKTRASIDVDKTLLIQR